MQTDLQTGRNISVMLYNGKSKIQTNSLYEYLESSRQKCTPIPLTNSNFNIIVKEVKLTETPDVTSFGNHSIYKVEMKGEII